MQAGNTRAVKIVQRKDEVLAAKPAGFAPLRQAAEVLSRATIHRAHAEVINEALMRFTVMAYEQDYSGRWVNIDTTGSLLLPAPWARHGGARWGLRRSESDVLRAVLLAYQSMHDKGKAPALYLYLPEERRWFVNLADFQTEPAAMGWAKAHQVTLAQWRHHSGQ